MHFWSAMTCTWGEKVTFSLGCPYRVQIPYFKILFRYFEIVPSFKNKSYWSKEMQMKHFSQKFYLCSLSYVNDSLHHQHSKHFFHLMKEWRPVPKTATLPNHVIYEIVSRECRPNARLSPSRSLFFLVSVGALFNVFIIWSRLKFRSFGTPCSWKKSASELEFM